jgi:hypothetical protein
LILYLFLSYSFYSLILQKERVRAAWRRVWRVFGTLELGVHTFKTKAHLHQTCLRSPCFTFSS